VRKFFRNGERGGRKANAGELGEDDVRALVSRERPRAGGLRAEESVRKRTAYAKRGARAAWISRTRDSVVAQSMQASVMETP